MEKSPTRDSQDSTYFFFRANSIIPTKENVEMRRQSSHDASKSFTHPDATESPASFLKLPTELQNLIWEETFSQPRIFDDDTLRLINPQDGIAYSYLTPYALYVCRGSRTFAQSRLCRTFLFRTWPPNSRRTISTRIAMSAFTDSPIFLGDRTSFLVDVYSIISR